jgi:hypothetical protein
MARPKPYGKLGIMLAMIAANSHQSATKLCTQQKQSLSAESANIQVHTNYEPRIHETRVGFGNLDTSAKPQTLEIQS